MAEQGAGLKVCTQQVLKVLKGCSVNRGSGMLHLGRWGCFKLSYFCRGLWEGPPLGDPRQLAAHVFPPL